MRNLSAFLISQLPPEMAQFLDNTEMRTNEYISNTFTKINT
jgi:hypothetical protein